LNQKVILAGGTGFIGKYLDQTFRELGYSVIIVSRQPGNIQWNNEKDIIEALENSVLLVNLAGRSVDCRYNAKNKSDILRSRTETTRALGRALVQCKNPPPLWINSSTATFYRDAKDRPMTEKNGEAGTGFSVSVAKQWEQSFFEFTLPTTRQVALRISIVLGKNGGVIGPLANLVRFGLGGKQGRGDQMFSWIHVEDLFRVIRFVQEHAELKGPIICATPGPVTNEKLMRSIRRQMKVSIGLPTPAWLLRIGALIIQTEPELILKSRWVIPEKLVDSGFKFKFPDLESALKDILGSKKHLA
jgi:uncharacterized protein (TIGR01777 family)